VIDPTLFAEVGIVIPTSDPMQLGDVSRCDLCSEAFYDDPGWKDKPLSQLRRFYATT
jgi:hypothetical protein